MVIGQWWSTNGDRTSSIGTARRRRRTLAAQLPDLASELARLIESGATLHTALEDLSSSYSDPAREEVASVVEDLRNGLLLDAALQEWSSRSQMSDVRLLASACRIGAAEGGDLVPALEGVSSALTDSLELAAEARSSSAQARTSAYVIMALPLLGLVLFASVDASVATFLFRSPLGLTLLSVGVLLDAVGAAAMIWLIRWSLR